MKMYSTAGFIIAFSVLLGMGMAVEFKDCGSKLGHINTLTIPGCTHPPCQLKQGTNVTISMNFSAHARITKATTKVYGHISLVKVPFPLGDSNACHYMKCPVENNTSVVYTMKLFVNPNYPKITVIIQWELVVEDTNGEEMITCFTIPGQITA